MSDDFYIGYRRQAPSALAAFVRKMLLVLFALVLVVVVNLVVWQSPFDPGTFEYGVVRQLEGVIAEEPYPQLLAERPEAAPSDAPVVSRYYLVAPGKHGAQGLVEGLAGRRVRLAGSLIYRDGQVMIELVPGSVEVLAGGAPPAVGEELGEVTLVGEIVDSKCFLGVMKPGRGKPHRACATLCIRGGIPPLLRVETAAGEHANYLLVDADGGAVNRRVLDWVAEPVVITGRLRRLGELLVLAADPATYRRPTHQDREET